MSGAKPTTRSSGSVSDQHTELDKDDPRAGTVDDPNVTDPYAHLREQALRGDGEGDSEPDGKGDDDS